MSLRQETMVASPCDTQTEAGHGPGQVTSRYRVVHVVVPEAVFNHVKAQAALSGMRFKTYMEMFLMEAFPLDGPEFDGTRT